MKNKISSQNGHLITRDMGSLLIRRMANFTGVFSYTWPHSPGEDFDSPKVEFDEFAFFLVFIIYLI